MNRAVARYLRERDESERDGLTKELRDAGRLSAVDGGGPTVEEARRGLAQKILGSGGDRIYLRGCAGSYRAKFMSLFCCIIFV